MNNLRVAIAERDALKKQLEEAEVIVAYLSRGSKKAAKREKRKKGGGGMSASARKKISIAMKARWAAQRATKKKHEET